MTLIPDGPVQGEQASITQVTIDSAGNLTRIEDPDGAGTDYGYSTPSNHRV